MTDNDRQALKGLAIVAIIFAAAGRYMLFGQSEPPQPSPFTVSGHIDGKLRHSALLSDREDACAEPGRPSGEPCKEHHAHAHPPHKHEGTHEEGHDPQHEVAQPELHVPERAPPHPVIHPVP